MPGPSPRSVRKRVEYCQVVESKMQMSRRAPADGKQLEELVANIEGLLLPEGFTITKNTRVHNDNGKQVAEFDIEIRGKLGSGNIAWLIECRNRPGEGAAPASWIEQLVGRRSLFKFDKIMAVSTTGFSEGAIHHAKAAGIELREVGGVAPEMAKWLSARDIRSHEYRHELIRAEMFIDPSESAERMDAANASLKGKVYGDLQLRIVKTGESISLVGAFDHMIKANPHMTADLIPNQPAKPVSFRASYRTDDGHVVVDTSLGPVRITEIAYEGKLSIIETSIPLSRVTEYRGVGAAQSVAQSAAFTIGDMILEFHQVTETGAIYLTAKLPGQEAAAPTTGETGSTK